MYTEQDIQCACPVAEGKGEYHHAGCHTFRAIYPELVGHKVNGADAPPPTFPDACPCCGAAKTREGYTDYKGEFHEGVFRWGTVEYACGGSYSPKPQCQTHTDKWWGRCGLTK